jgi:hypothetical protein
MRKQRGMLSVDWSPGRDAVGMYNRWRMRGSRNTFWRDTALVALIAAAARLIFLWLLPQGVESVDLQSWQKVAGELHAGRNPYQTTPFLNWPPLWLQIIALVDKSAQLLHLPFKTLLRLVLITSDVAVVVVAHRIAVFVELAKARSLVLVGLALNPISILLVCQHANFDTLVALAILLAVAALIRFGVSDHPVDWLFAALALGIGTLTKTIPMILIPLLSAHWKRLDDRTRILGALLFIGPVALGLSVLLALAPHAIFQHVIQYRSVGGVFGVSGILAATVTPPLARLVRIVLLLTFGAIALSASVWTAMHQLKDPRRFILLGAFLLISIIVLGPGYGPQYISWFLPLLVLSANSFDSIWRRLLVTWAAIATVTYLVEYLFLPELGALFPRILPGANFPWESLLTTPAGLTMLRLPLFLAYCLLWAKAGATLMNDRKLETA